MKQLQLLSEDKSIDMYLALALAGPVARLRVGTANG
jgi:hypothetical protein